MMRIDSIFSLLPYGHDLHWRLKALSRSRGRALFSARWPRKKVVLFHIGRCGSSVLGNLLNQHRRICWDSEIYEQWFQSMEMRRRPLAKAAKQMDPVEYLSRRLAWSGPFHYGMEVKFFHLNLFGVSLFDYIDRIHDIGFRHFILLERKNTLRAVVSSLIAARTGKWHQPFRSKAPVLPEPIDVGPGEIGIDRERKPLLAFLEDYRDRFIELEGLLKGKRMLRLTYEEDLYSDPVKGYQRVCSFLGERPEAVTVRYRKTNPFPLRQLVRDLEQVQKALHGTPFEWMADA
ncbi:MAG: hypothetical protein PVG49_15430 [Desulfobacteraceae bacterium]|jgi:hypothetical protein